MPGEKKVFKEVCCFCAVVVLVAAQVVVYRFDHDKEKYGLDIDHAKLVFVNTLNQGEIQVAYTSKNCYKCSPTILSDQPIPVGGNITYDVDTTFPVTIFMNTSTSSCNRSYHFREYSLHNFTLSVGVVNCSSHVVDVGEDSYLTILYAALMIGVLSGLWVAVTSLYRFVLKRKSKKDIVRGPSPHHQHQPVREESEDDSAHIQGKDPLKGKEENSSPLMYGSIDSRRRKSASSVGSLKSSLITDGTSAVTSDSKPKKRLNSLDAFRGFSLTIMIFVNYGGGGYWFFKHSKWNGLTVADLVFPWFVWIMGVSIVFSAHGRKKDSFDHQLYQIFRRTIILFAFGLFLISNDSSSPLSEMRICGVLQRLAASYFVVAITELFTNQLRRWKKFSLWRPVNDITGNWVQWVMVIVLEGLWLMITFLLSDDNCPTGYLGPGGISESSEHMNCTGGAARVVDYWILREEHLYPRNTATSLYHLVKRFEPEGILGTLNSVVLCYLGAQAGRTLMCFKGRHTSILSRLTIWGIVLCTLATLLCLGQKDEGLIPVNKNMWSLSYILLLGGFGYFVLAVFYLIIDVFPFWSGAPFKYPGMNSILVYMCHELLHEHFPFSIYNENHTHLTYLSSNLIAVALWLMVSYYWYTVQFFIKI